jgi:CxxC motif-containing protein (DUF1111 family)
MRSAPVSVCCLALIGTGLIAVSAAQEPSRGAELFRKVWTVEEGLGPRFNGVSCRSCHSDLDSRPAIEPPVFVWVDQSLTDPTGGHLFQRFGVTPLGKIDGFEPPRTAGKRRAPLLFGLGLLERALQRGGTGRFGWKARYSSLDAAIAGALAGEMGLTSDRFPSAHQRAVEVPAVQVESLADFVRSLPPPLPQGDRRNFQDGERIFTAIGCSACHQPELALTTAGPMNGAVARAYTDLQLHDLGPALADGVTEGRATSFQFRSAPLWGIGQIRSGFLHDGRAATLTDAILAHDGEARSVIDRYRQLGPDRTAALVAFISSL